MNMLDFYILMFRVNWWDEDAVRTKIESEMIEKSKKICAQKETPWN